jgi:hypothetical protein
MTLGGHGETTTTTTETIARGISAPPPRLTRSAAAGLRPSPAARRRTDGRSMTGGAGANHEGRHRATKFVTSIF